MALPFGGALTTGLATAAAPRGQVAVGSAGKEGGILRIWP